MARFLPERSNMNSRLGHMGKVRRLHLVGVIAAGEIALHQPVEELDILDRALASSAAVQSRSGTARERRNLPS